jgi:hypothetical protein
MNVHQIFDIRIDNYNYFKDSILVTSGYYDGGWCESATSYNNDSTIIRYKVLYEHDNRTIRIDCNRSKLPPGSTCVMTYRNKVIATFPRDQFELQSETARFMYERKMNEIDRALK